MSNFKNCFAFDFGTSHFRVYHEGKKKIDVASELEQGGKVYTELVKNGVIADFNACDTLIRQNLKKIQKPILGFLGRPFSSIVSVPSNNNEVSLRAFRDLMEYAGSANVWMMQDCYLMGLGLGINIGYETYSIVDFGAGKTSITTVENKRIVNAEVVDCSLLILIDQLKTYLSINHEIIISDKSAEKLIIEFADFKLDDSREKLLRIEGTIKNSKEKTTVSIKNTEISGCLQNEIQLLIERIVRHIEKLDNDLKEKVFQRGLYVTGGASNIKGFKEVLRGKINVASQSYSSSESFLSDGIKMVLHKPEKYKEFMLR